MKTLAAAVTFLVGFVTAPVLILAILVPMMAGGMQAQQQLTSAAAECNNWGGGQPAPEGLTAQQLQRAALIYGTARELGLGPQAAVVGIATALQESSLSADPRSRRPDANSNIGLFQQRVLPGWHADGNTIAENIKILLDDHYQTQVFFQGHTTTNGWHIPGLADIPNWQHLPVTQAAQTVQASAFPDAYAKHEPTARTLVTTLAANGTTDATPCQAQDSNLTCPAIPAAVGTEAGQTPDAIRVMRCVAAKWPQIRSIGGLRPGDPRDHGTGRAVDVMIPNWHTPTGHALGSEIASWAQTNATALGVTYVIWNKKIWSVAQANSGWRDCAEGSCYAGTDPSAAHLDHVHISVSGNQGTNTPDTPHATAALPIDKGKYRISAHYGQPGTRWATRHTGLDFAAPTGTPIRAVTAGTVVSAFNTHGVYGKLTKIRATDGTQIWYAHQSRITIHEGQQVTAGQIIGEVGETGNASGPHLHLEIRITGRAIDPLAWLREQGLQP